MEETGCNLIIINGSKVGIVHLPAGDKGLMSLEMAHQSKPDHAMTGLANILSASTSG